MMPPIAGTRYPAPPSDNSTGDGRPRIYIYVLWSWKREASTDKQHFLMNAAHAAFSHACILLSYQGRAMKMAVLP